MIIVRFTKIFARFSAPDRAATAALAAAGRDIFGEPGEVVRRNPI